MLGNKTIDWLINLTETIEKLNDALIGLKSLPVAPLTPAVFPTLDIVTIAAKDNLKKIKESLTNDLLISKNNFTL